MSSDYVCDGRLDCGRYSPSGVYLEGLVFVNVWSGVDFLVVDFDMDHPYVYNLTHSREVGREANLGDFKNLMWQESRYPNPAGQYSVGLRSEFTGVRRLVGTVGVEQVSELALVAREYVTSPGAMPYMWQLPAGRELVYVRTVEGWRSVRWGGGFYRPVAGSLTADVLDAAWEQIAVPR